MSFGDSGSLIEAAYSPLVLMFAPSGGVEGLDLEATTFAII